MSTNPTQPCQVRLLENNFYEHGNEIFKYGRRFNVLKGTEIAHGSYNTLRKVHFLQPMQNTMFQTQDLPAIQEFLQKEGLQYNAVYRKYQFSVDFSKFNEITDREDFFRCYDRECQLLTREDAILTTIEKSPFTIYFPKIFAHGLGIDTNPGKNPAQLVNRYFQFMEYVPGGSLFHKIAKTPITPKEAIGYFHQIIHILEILHTQLHIIHRDLNLANLLIGENNQIKITDFGFGVKMSEIEEEVIGAAYYMPPESQEPTEPSDKWDIYSLGITLFEIFLHTRPSLLPNPKKDEFFLLLRDVVNERYDGTLTKRFNCYGGRTYEDVKPEDPFLLLIWSMLQPSPTERPSIVEVKQRIETIFGPAPVAAPSPSTGGPSITT